MNESEHKARPGNRLMKRRASAGFIALGAGALLLAPVIAVAEVTLDTSAYAQYEYDSNVFYLAPGVLAPDGRPDPSDSVLTTGGKFMVAELWQQQQVYLSLQGSDVRYDHFTELDHTDYNLDGGWVWKLGRDWDGRLEVTRLRDEVPFTYLVSTQLFLQTEQRETASANLQFSSDWRIEGIGYTRQVDLPQQQAPDLRLTESSGQLALKYTGISRTTAGVMATYVTGNYDNTDFLNTVVGFSRTYHQTTVGLTSTYSVSGLTSLVGQIGYTRRETPNPAADDSGVTGDLHYKRALTVKTSIDVEFSRELQSYITGVGSELDSNANLQIRWEATYKVAVAALYAYTYRQLPNQGFVPGTDRLDHLQSTTLQVDYGVRKWLSIRPYVRYQTRSSSYPEGDFTGTAIGLNFTVQWQKGHRPSS
jgi:Putative beta-barrel porin 2